LFSSKEDRIALIQGLMDTDGYAVKSGGTGFEFYQKSEKMIDDFRFILSSLGVKSRKSAHEVKGEKYYTVRFCTKKFVPFRLERKALLCERVLGHEKNDHFYVKDITETESVSVRCITVDNDSHLYLAGTSLIPTHNTTTSAAYMLWYIIFNDDKLVAILANKEKTAREILNRVKVAYQNLPFWLQQGVVEWNKSSIVLDNNSRIIAESTSSSAIRGWTINLLYLDEFAFVQNNMAEEFFSSVYPTISSGKTTKLIVVSTPNGFNHFYRLWDEAKKNLNGLTPFEFSWRDIPGRDDAWAENQRRTLGEIKFRQEIECEFLGSSLTLISPNFIAAMSSDVPLMEKEGLIIYEQPQTAHSYIMTVDVARGRWLDYSAFIVFDVSVQPYKIVARYRNNQIAPLVYPSIIHAIGKKYNDAYLLVEINDIGQQVADILWGELEYENMFFTNQSRSKALESQKIGVSQDIMHPGLRTTKPTKRIGCEAFRSLVETRQLLINDYALIGEISTFVQIKDLYAADQGHHDDLVMCCVLFSWLTTQTWFKDLTNIDIRERVLMHQAQMLDDMTLPIIMRGNLESDDAIEQEREVIAGDVWFNVKEAFH
jgi:hypothetical protein